jgi:hypothetical protein
MVFRLNHDVARKIRDARVQHGGAVGIREVRVFEVERIRQRHQRTADRGDFHGRFAPGRNEDAGLCQDRLRGIRDQQLVARRPALWCARQRDRLRAFRETADRVEKRGLATANPRFASEVYETVTPLIRVDRRVDRHVADDESDARAARNWIGGSTDVEHAIRHHDQMRKGQRRVV